MLDLPEAEINFGEAALVVTHDYVNDYDIRDGLKKLDEIAERVRVLLAQQPDGDEPLVRIATINTVLFREYGFHYDLTDFPKQTAEKRLLGNLLRRGQGTCANLPDLYYVVAERLGFPIYLVEAPQHAFLRYVLPNGEHINIEATGGGGRSSDEDYIAEMEIPKAALASGTYMRTLSRREALFSLIAERTFHDDRGGAFERVLAEAALLRKLRPNHAPTFWNSAVWEAIAGRANRELAKTDPEFAPLAEQSFQRARGFAKIAIELGAMKPDDKGEYAQRQETIRLMRLGETVLPLTPLEEWDALAEIERVIAAPPNGEFDYVTAFRRTTPPSLPSALAHRLPRGPDSLSGPPMKNPAREAMEKELAALREADEINRYNEQEMARMDALSGALRRESMSVRHEDKLEALRQITALTGAGPQVFSKPQTFDALGRGQ